MAKIEVQNSGWNSLGTQKGGGLGTLGSILSHIPTKPTKIIGGVLSNLEAARNGDGSGLLKGVVSSIAGGKKPGGDAFGNELSEAQGMFGDKNMNVGGLRTAGETPTLGRMH